MKFIDTIGTYIFRVIESALALTQKNKYPQWVVKARAVQKWVQTAEELTHYGLTEPAYVDCEEWDEHVLGYLVLFKANVENNEPCDENTQLMNYAQLQAAMGWEGTSFGDLDDGTFVGKRFLGRMSENEYNGKVTIQLDWVDSVDASPTRELRKLDAAKVAHISSLLRVGPKATPVKPATAPKPASAARKPGKQPSASPAAGKPAVATPAPASKPPGTPRVAPSPNAAIETVAEPTVVASVPGLPAETDKASAWQHINVVKGDNDDNVIAEAWIAACAEVGGDRTEDRFTGTDWAQIRDIIVRDLSLTVA